MVGDTFISFYRQETIKTQIEAMDAHTVEPSPVDTLPQWTLFARPVSTIYCPWPHLVSLVWTPCYCRKWEKAINFDTSGPVYRYLPIGFPPNL